MRKSLLISLSALLSSMDFDSMSVIFFSCITLAVLDLLMTHIAYVCRMVMEADHIGILLLGAAGFHPNTALNYLWKQAKIDERTTVFENFVSPYPSYKKRLERLSQPAVMEKAMKLYRESTPDQGGTMRQAARVGP
jgi:predicted Zn-dependent protease